MNEDREAVFSAKIKEAHELMLAGVKKLNFAPDGIENKDDAQELAVIQRWADYSAVEKECACK